MLVCNINKKIIPCDYGIINIVKRLYNTPGNASNVLADVTIWFFRHTLVQTAFVYVWKSQNSDLTERGNLVDNFPARWCFYWKPDEDIHATGTESNRCLHYNQKNKFFRTLQMTTQQKINPKKVISSRSLQMTTQQETVTHCLLLTLRPIYLQNLSPHASPQPITSRVYQLLLYLLTNQIAHLGF